MYKRKVQFEPSIHEFMINSSTTPKQLATLLGVSYANLTNTVYSIGVNNLYTSFTIPKKNGSLRHINAPEPRLYHLQSRLRLLLESLFSPHPAASAFIKGRGIIYNAKKHTKKAAVFNIDLEDFYDQINFGRISGLLSAKPYSLKKETSFLIAHICCYKKKLPQGAPTSPIISNMICKGLDHRLSLLAKQNKAQFTRYADDITFSFRELSKNNIYDYDNGSLVPAANLCQIITDYNFKINAKKTRINFYHERQTVTGLKVNSKVNIDRRFIRTTRAMIFSLENGISNANKIYKTKNPDTESLLENVVHGRISYIGMIKGIESTVYQTLAQKFNKLPLKIRANLKPKSHHPDLVKNLQSSIHKNRDKLCLSIFILDFEGINCDEELTQGTAFVLSGNRIITTYHSFIKAGNTDECYLYTVKNPTQRFKAKIKRSCSISDIAELEIIDKNKPDLVPLKMGKSISSNAYGYKLAIIGFPQFQPGHLSVSIIPCTVINTYIRSTFKWIEVDASIDAGNSGGPILNIYMEVVGMAVFGRSVTLDGKEAQLEGSNAFISVEHLLSSATTDT